METAKTAGKSTERSVIENGSFCARNKRRKSKRKSIGSIPFGTAINSKEIR